MHHSIEPRDWIHGKGYGFLSFARNTNKNLSNKYSQKIIESAKKSATDPIKTASKRPIQKTAEATGDLIDNKIVDKITSVSKKKKKTPKNNLKAVVSEKEIPKKYIYLQKTSNKLLSK